MTEAEYVIQNDECSSYVEVQIKRLQMCRHSCRPQLKDEVACYCVLQAPGRSTGF